jgi:hypothetical protein
LDGVLEEEDALGVEAPEGSVSVDLVVGHGDEDDFGSVFDFSELEAVVLTVFGDDDVGVDETVGHDDLTLFEVQEFGVVFVVVPEFIVGNDVVELSEVGLVQIEHPNSTAEHVVLENVAFEVGINFSLSLEIHVRRIVLTIAARTIVDSTT